MYINKPLKDSRDSDRNFGILCALLLCIFSIYSKYKNFNEITILSTFITGVTLLPISFYLPKLLAPFNKAWFQLGYFLGKMTSPLILGVIFFFFITPIAVITRFFGRDELKLRKSNPISYWVNRYPSAYPGPELESFKNQF
jgi:hypothetical protein